MAEPLPYLNTKLHAPAGRPDLVVRTRLVERIRAGLNGHLTLLCAPAGFGKTTLLAQALRQVAGGSQAERPPVPAASGDAPAGHLAWLTLEPDDDDPARFFTYLAAALDPARPGVAQAMTGLLRSPRPLTLPPRTLMASLLSAAAAADSAGPVWLVLDDYHTLTSPALHDSVAFLLDHLPEGLRLVIASRANPPLPLARLRARGLLTEIRAGDLRFSTSETACFLNEQMGLGLAAADLDALVSRTEGWAAGLRLVALALRTHEQAGDDRAAFLAGFAGSHRFIVDYLTEEVIGRQAPRVRNFLLGTCLLRRLSGPLCDAVLAHEPGLQDRTPQPATPVEPSSTVLEYLDRESLFVIPLDGERRWYRYHPLFAEALASLARPSPEAAAGLHRRAADWLAAHEITGEALWHALAAGDLERAACLVRRGYPALVQRGELATLQGWLKALSPEVVERDARLCLAMSWAYAYEAEGKIFRRHLRLAEAALDSLPDAEARPLRGEAAVLEAVYVSVYWQPQAAQRLAEQALALLPPDDARLRAVACQALGNAHRLRGDLAAAERAYAEVLNFDQSANGSLFGVIARSRLGQVQQQQGRLRQAAQTFEDVAALGRRFPGLQLYTAESLVHLAEVHYEWNELQAAKTLLEQGLSLAEHSRNPTIVLPGHLLRARLLAAGGDWAAAQQALRQAEALCAAHNFPAAVAARVSALRAVLALRAGHAEAACEWAAALGPRRHGNGLPPDDELLALAQVCLATGRPADADRHLAMVRRVAEQQGRHSTTLAALALQALAWHAQRETPRALAALCQALAGAESEGMVRLFLEAGPGMGDLLRRVRGGPSDYARRLLAAWPAGAARSSTGPAAGSGPWLNPDGAFLAEALSPRELEVLERLASGQTNRAIAEQLVISVGTVKTHISRIMGKLGAANRTEAAALGRQLGLLP